MTFRDFLIRFGFVAVVNHTRRVIRRVVGFFPMLHDTRVRLC